MKRTGNFANLENVWISEEMLKWRVAKRLIFIYTGFIEIVNVMVFRHSMNRIVKISLWNQ